MKLATTLNAYLIQGAGLALQIASCFPPRHSPLEEILDTLGMALILGGLAIHAYIRGQRAGYGKGLVDGAAKEARLHFGALGNVPFTAKDKLWEALPESGDAAPAEGIVWGTDYWGDILSEPSEQQARALAQASASNVYSRQPHCEWVLDTHNTTGATK